MFYGQNAQISLPIIIGWINLSGISSRGRLKPQIFIASDKCSMSEFIVRSNASIVSMDVSVVSS